MTAITATPKSIRPHLMMAEIEEESGYRHWSKPMSKMELDMWIREQCKYGAYLSDVDCSSTCWCVPDYLK